MSKDTHKKSFIVRCIDNIKEYWGYCSSGVWQEKRSNIWIKLLKTLNLCVRTFFDTELQVRSAALTYSTVLAIVPAFALLLAIGRGFGLSTTLTTELYKYFPSQHKAMETALTFVDSYLSQASQGLFVGIGIVFLLYTLYSLLGNIEDTFNKLWGVTHQRSIYRKITDYSAICLIVPVLMACSSGISIVMTSTVQNTINLPLLTPLLSFVLDAVPFLLVWVAFTLSFMFIPNTKVDIRYAIISGFVCGVAFQILQILFLNGQIYVSKYNAVYGSFAFLPLLLIWLQFSWLILLFGCILTYSLQNVFMFTYIRDINNISADYMRRLTTVITAIVARNTNNSTNPPLTIEEISIRYNLPIRLTTRIVEMLHELGVVYYVILDKGKSGIITAIDINTFTLGDLFEKTDNYGVSDFIPRFKSRYTKILGTLDRLGIERIDRDRNVTIASLASHIRI